MLPDLRIVIAAVVSTFICTVGVGFYASSRLLQEPLTTRTDNPEDSPVNRIALSWPEPLPQDRTLNLDFAVTAKVAKNPVRDVVEPSAEPQSNAGATQPSSVVSDLDAAQGQVAKDFAKEVAKEIVKETAKEFAKEAAKEIAKELSKDTAIRVAAGPSLVEPDPHRLSRGATSRVVVGPSLVEPDPHRLEIDPPATASIRDAKETAAHEADQTTASIPDRTEAADALASKGEPTTRIRIVKKPVAAKARVRRKTRVVATPPAPPALPAFPSSTAQLQFPFIFFLGTSSPN
jgi:hypothetical protein